MVNSTAKKERNPAYAYLIVSNHHADHAEWLECGNRNPAIKQ